MTIPNLATPHLILRPLREGDFPDLFEYAQQPAVASNGMWRPYASEEKARADFLHWLTLYPRGFMWWALEEKAGGKMIGRCQLDDYNPDDARADISYALHQNFWGRGYMTEAAQHVALYAFDELKLNRLSATVFPDNLASIRLLEKLGMTREGILRQHRSTRGAPEDVHLYAVLRPEWEAAQRRHHSQ